MQAILETSKSNTYFNSNVRAGDFVVYGSQAVHFSTVSNSSAASVMSVSNSNMYCMNVVSPSLNGNTVTASNLTLYGTDTFTPQQAGGLLMRYNSNSTQPLSNTTTITVTYDSEECSIGDHQLSYSNGLFTNTGNTGWYMVTCSTSFGSNGNGYRCTYVSLNGNTASNRFGHVTDYATGYVTVLNGHGIVCLSNNDYLTVNAYQKGIGAVIPVGQCSNMTDGYSTRVEIARLF